MQKSIQKKKIIWDILFFVLSALAIGYTYARAYSSYGPYAYLQAGVLLLFVVLSMTTAGTYTMAGLGISLVSLFALTPLIPFSWLVTYSNPAHYIDGKVKLILDFAGAFAPAIFLAILLFMLLRDGEMKAVFDRMLPFVLGILLAVAGIFVADYRYAFRFFAGALFALTAASMAIEVSGNKSRARGTLWLLQILLLMLAVYRNLQALFL